MPINEISEQNPNGHCNVDFVFTLGSNKCFLYMCHHGTVSIMNLYLFLKCIFSDLKTYSSLFLTCVVSVIFCAITCGYWNGKWHCKCKL